MTDFSEEAPAPGDIWSEWLLRHRFGDDDDYRVIAEKRILEYADIVLDQAALKSGASVLDVGAGTGTLAFRALERCAGDLSLTLCDVSPRLLQIAKGEARERGYSSRCRFVEASAEKLTGIADGTMDVVVARASIAYVGDKAAAFREMFRVLKPGGRISLAEPILQEEAFSVRIMRQRLERGERGDPFLELLHRWKSALYPDNEKAYADTPLVNFSERDLLAHARRAGFRPLHLRLHIDVAPALIDSWKVFLASSPHPQAPTLNDILEHRFSVEERGRFEQWVRPTVESGSNFDTDRVAYLFGSKPAG